MFKDLQHILLLRSRTFTH